MEITQELFKELNEMRVDIPQDPADVYPTTTALQNYLNRLAEIQVNVLSILATANDKDVRNEYRCLLKAAEVVAGNLKLAKQQIAMLVNSSHILDSPKTPKKRELTDSDRMFNLEEETSFNLEL